MGKIYSVSYYKHTMPDEIPKSNDKPTFDSHLGFEEKRIKRDIKLSEKELRSLKISPKYWDYCTDLLKDVQTCQKNSLPFINMFCRKEIGLYKHCRHEDYILRMKEYERERRLRVRQKKLEGKSVN